MTVFKATIQVLKKNKVNLLIGIIGTFFLIFFMSMQLSSSKISEPKAKIAVITKEKTPLTDSFTNYIAKNQELVTLKDTSEEGVNDALYFRLVSYVVWLPKDLETKLITDKDLALKTKTQPNNSKGQWMDRVVNQYFNTYLTLAKQNPDEDMNKLIAKTEKISSAGGQIKIDQSFQQKQKRILTAVVFNTLSYGLFIIIFSSFGIISYAFNRKSIQVRQQSAPLSPLKLTQKVQSSTLLFISMISILFIGLLLAYTRPGWNLTTGLLIINSLCIISAMISITAFVTSLISNPEVVSGVSNIVVMGSCFIGGVFLPVTILPDIAQKIGSFTPTYWFTQNNQLIGETLTYTKEVTTQFFQQCLIILAFTAAFIVLQMIVKKGKRLPV
ncbi:ABC transporter permease [Vagococcus silagei]|uniref:ABC transporter permease n=1 Tax=Vagococcus silagei TaxID=2508885 RepID=A0A4S3B4L3_9ENTE|nr:ABC transporter permease [Vagococcus silagei]THB60740.1 ABC transporter permease [Vagococcus silagei]